MFSSSFRAFVLLSAVVQVAVALPASTTQPTRHATYAKRELPEGRTLSTYHPPSKFEVYGRAGIQRRSLASNNGDFKAAGLQFVKSKFGAAAADDEMDVVSEYKTSHGSHVWVSQNYKGIPIANTLANVALNQNGDVLSYSSSLVDFKKSSSFVSGGGYKTEPKLTADDATLSALKHLGGGIADAKRAPALQFFAVEDGSLKLTHAVRLTTAKNHLLDAFVDAESGDLRGVMDYTFELSARVVPITARNPEEAYELLENIENLDASPLGWLNAAKANYTATLGNNGVVGQFDPDTLGSYKDAIQFTTNMTGENVFDYTYDSTMAPTEGNNVNAANVNAFYVTNMAHDILYRYGFKEETFNFQYQSTGDAKTAPDMLLTRVHDPSDEDNASFTSPPDGVPPLMRLHLFTATTPGRDTALENDIILHEFAHGLSNRLTGGGTARCLESVESRGLGEGWSDAFSNWVWQTGSPETVRDFATGEWILGNTGGVRSHPYSLDQSVNPLKYGDVAGKEEEHTIGEVWAQALHMVLGKLVDTVGSSADALTNSDGEGGHAVFMRLLVDSLAIQPCNPTFTDARSAWIQADDVRYAGKHKCALWTAFAAAGLGDGAANFANSDKIPADACSTSCKARKARA